MRFQLDLTIQFLLKQGQVELESAAELIPDYTDAILIHKSVIEELNCTIRVIYIFWRKLRALNEWIFLWRLQLLSSLTSL